MGNEVDARRPVSSYWRDVAWQSSGTTLAHVVSLVGMPVLARLYTPEDFAVQSLFLQVVTYATAIATWRYEYFVPLPKLDEEVRALNRLVLILGALTAFAFTPILWIFRHALAAPLGNSELAGWLFLAPVTATLFSWAVAAQINSQRVGDFRTSGFSELIGKVAYVSTGIVSPFVYPGALGLVLTTAFAAIGKSAFVFVRRPAWNETSLRSDAISVRRVQRKYGRLATSTVASHLLSTSAFAIPQFAIAKLYDADVLGQFALVMATIFLPSGLLGTAIGQVYYQRAAQEWAEGRAFFSLWRDMVQKLCLIGLPIYAAAMLLSKFVYPFVFGDQWHMAGEFASWMSLAAFATFVSSPMDRTCLIVGAAWYSVLWSVFRLMSALVLVWVASELHLSSASFVIAFVFQMCLALGIDLFMSCRFSRGRLRFFARG